MKFSLSYSDYYPFGMVIEGRSASSGDQYRYGFNGQEEEKEISGNESHTSAEYWMYDSRLGRRWNVDPIIKVWESPYATMHNNPLLIFDEKGNTGDVSINKTPVESNGTQYSGTITITVDLWFYGYGAEKKQSEGGEYFTLLAQSIEDDYNSANGTYTFVDGENKGTYLVVFSIKGHYLSMVQAWDIMTDETKRKIFEGDSPFSANLIRLEEDGGTGTSGTSFMNIDGIKVNGQSLIGGGNSGFWQLDDGLISNKTASHEVFHAISGDKFSHATYDKTSNDIATPSNASSKPSERKVTKNNISQIMNSINWDSTLRGHIGNSNRPMYTLYDRNQVIINLWYDILSQVLPKSPGQYRPYINLMKKEFISERSVSRPICIPEK